MNTTTKRLTAEELAAEVARLCEENGIGFTVDDYDGSVTFRPVNAGYVVIITIDGCRIELSTEPTKEELERIDILRVERDRERQSIIDARLASSETDFTAPYDSDMAARAYSHLTELRHSPAPADGDLV